MTLEDVYEDWLRWKLREVAATSMEVYRQAWKHVHELARRNVEELTPRDWRSLALTLMDEGKTIKTAKRANMLCGTLMRYAGEELGLKVVSHWRIKWPRTGCKGMHKVVFGDKDTRLVLAKALERMGSGFHLLVAIGFMCGLREGELCALRWSDVDLQARTLTVERTAVRERGSRTLIHPTKTESSNRVVPLPEWIAVWAEALGKGKPSESYIGRVTTRRNGSVSYPERLMIPMDTRVFRDRWRRFLSDCGVRYVNAHGMRHKFATTMVEAGVDVKTVQTLLGHSNIGTTLNTYCHTSDAAKRRAMEVGVEAKYGLQNYPKISSFRINRGGKMK